MDLRILYGMIAEAILVTHFAFIAFVVFGFILTVCGGFRDWPWVRNPWFRVVHLTVIWVVVAQVWLGVVCPFTTLEMSLRALAGQATYDGTFIAHWLRRLVYFHQLPHTFFIASYTALGLVAVTCWVAIRPRPFRQAACKATVTRRDEIYKDPFPNPHFYRRGQSRLTGIGCEVSRCEGGDRIPPSP